MIAGGSLGGFCFFFFLVMLRIAVGAAHTLGGEGRISIPLSRAAPGADYKPRHAAGRAGGSGGARLRRQTWQQPAAAAAGPERVRLGGGDGCAGAGRGGCAAPRAAPAAAAAARPGGEWRRPPRPGAAGGRAGAGCPPFPRAGVAALGAAGGVGRKLGAGRAPLGLGAAAAPAGAPGGLDTAQPGIAGLRQLSSGVFPQPVCCFRASLPPCLSKTPPRENPPRRAAVFPRASGCGLEPPARPGLVPAPGALTGGRFLRS